MKLSLGSLIGVVAIVLAGLITLGVVLAPVAGLAMSTNTGARVWGGTVEYTLPPGQKLVGATWKDEDHSIWTLEREAHPGEKPETYVFRQHQNLPILPAGKVVFHETAAAAF
jgi:hypothetical protein